ncbi:MAG: BTAD domain-containing putative transcriptional regulator [Kineosporiaceae bacterium]
MRVSLLGPVAASTGEADLPLGGLKQRAVFALLALHAGRVVALDRLVDEVWSDEPPSRATLSLQSYVARLRRVLAAGGDVDAPRILTRPPGWILTLDPEQVDVTRFEGLISAARRALGSGGTAGAAHAARSLEEALALWRGEPLGGLEGVRFAREQAVRLDELRLGATELLLQAQLDLGETDSVAERSRQFVGEHPYRERGWCALMLALYRCGRQAEALAAAAGLRRVLATELGVSPSPEVRRLEEQILRHDAALSLSATELTGLSPEAGTASEESPGASATDPRSSLVGRDDALSLVSAAVERAESGQGRLLVLHAPTGMGKSSVLQALEERVRADGGVVVRGDCIGPGTAPALWPWVTIVRGITDTETPLVAGGLDAREADAGLARTRLFRGVIDAVAGARAAGPLAVVMDDVHWADADTLTLLSLAVDELARHGVLFAVAVRSDEPGSDAVLALLDRLRRTDVQRVSLAPLETAEVAAVVRELSGADADPHVVAAIRSRTGGNPLFVCELVRLLSSEGRLDADGVRATLPGEVGRSCATGSPGCLSRPWRC